MAKAKTEQAVQPTAETGIDTAGLTEAVPAQIAALQAELSAAESRIAELEQALEQAVFAAGEEDGEPLIPEPGFTVGDADADADAEVAAVKSCHGHPFFRAGYKVLPEWTFVRRADFEPADFARLIGDRMVVAREALPKEAS